MQISLRLSHKQPVTSNIWSFIFEPSQPLSWIAGQFIRIELPHASPDSEGTKRWFTIASAPYERRVQLTTRITGSSFKQALAELPLGGTIQLLDAPAGDFIWPAGAPTGPLIFVAQGIGITPFHSIIKQRHHDGAPLTLALFYSNQTGGIPFGTELRDWSDHSAMELHVSSEVFTADKLIQLVPQLSSAQIYVSGPKSLRKLLGPPTNLTSSQLRQDFFPNYDATSY